VKRDKGLIFSVLLLPLVLTSCVSPPTLSLETQKTPPPTTTPTNQYEDFLDKPIFSHGYDKYTNSLSPLSGRYGGLGKEILVAKIDNTPSAQPQSGLSKADLVYVTEVEGGLTRLIALFATDIPEKVGPIRSARISDISILEPYGKVTFAYSGAQSKMLPYLAAAKLVDASPLSGSPGWFRETWRPVSYINLMATPTALLDWSGGTAKTQDLGWKFSPLPPANRAREGKPAKWVTANWDGSSMGFVWDTQKRGWVVYANGARTQASEGGSQIASTVLIQSVKQEDSGFGDRYGGKTPLIRTVGQGKVLMLRDGRMWEGKWSRPNGETPTAYKYEDGETMSFDPGQVWIVLLDSSRNIQVQK